MNKRDLKKFEKLLLKRREEILAGLDSMRGDLLYQKMTDRPTGDVDAAAEIGTDSFERETALRVYGNEAEELREIDAALERINEGTYGVCEGTGKPIPKKRLEAFPTARYCVEYQAELEKDSRTQGWR
ncbi:MAG: TraR/DksA family transcriptional regulator [Candidatus Hydrogenedentota bacterium]